MQGYIHFYFDSFSIFVVRRQDQEQALNGGGKIMLFKHDLML